MLPSAIIVRSSPAQKARPSPRTTTTSTPSSAATSSTARPRSATQARFIAFSAAGRFRTISAIGPSRRGSTASAGGVVDMARSGQSVLALVEHAAGLAVGARQAAHVQRLDARREPDSALESVDDRLHVYGARRA